MSSDNPYGQGMSGADFIGGGNPPGGPPQPNVDGKITPAAVALIVVGALSTLSSVYGVINVLVMDGGRAQMEQALEQVREEQGEDSPAIPFIEAMLKVSTGPVAIAMNLVGLVVAALILGGGIQMSRKKSYGLAMGGAIAAMLPIGSCCCIGIPVGIWVLVVLLDSNVKQSFR